MKSKWQMHRAGLINFWYYDEEEFYFADGKLLLRGSNGSGKSVTMQSLIPLLLDGRKSPDRLDPFGSRARRIEDYLLGEKELVERDERTGYLYLEYKREHTDQYLTTGIGLQAKNHAPLDFWGFVIHDNRRLGRDLWLYKTEYDVDEAKEQKIPLSRKELENLIGEGGKVVRTQGEYMELVNRYVFGFESLEAYEDLIKLLIQLRSPKLSKDFKPTVIYEILNDSLPALSDDELRPLSDTIESMDQAKQQLEQLMRVQNSLDRICRQYDEYNRFVLAEKAAGLLQGDKRCEKLARKGEELEKQLADLRAWEQEAARGLRERELEQQVLSREVQELREHDVFRAEAQKQEMESLLTETITQTDRKKSSLQQKRQTEGRLLDSIKKEELAEAKAESKLEDLLAALGEEADAAGFIHHSVSEAEFRRQYQGTYGFGLWRQDATEYQERIEKGLEVLRDETSAKERYHEADRVLAQARMELDKVRGEERRWGELFEEEKASWLDHFHRWRQENQELILLDTEVQSACQRLMRIYEEYRFEDVSAPILVAYNRHYQTLEKALLANRHEAELKTEEIREKEFQLHELRNTKDVEPPRHPDTEATRAMLREQGVPHIAFFAAVEFKEHVEADRRERIEAAISEMGLLDALIIPKGYHDGVTKSDRIIRPRKLPAYVATTLADFLYPTPVEGSGVGARDIAEILGSIAVRGLDDGKAKGMNPGQQASLALAMGSGSSMWEAELANGTTILELDGTYHLGPLFGHAARREQSIYIGKEARRQYRLRKMAQLESELAELGGELSAIQADGQAITDQQEQLNLEYGALPSDADLGEAYLTLEKTKRQREASAQDVEWKNERLKESLSQWQAAQELVRRYTGEMDIVATEAAYEVARRDMQAYMRHFQDLQLSHKDYLNSRDRITHYRYTLEDVQQDVDELVGEINSLQASKERLELQLDQVKQRLEELGAEEIRAKIAEVVQRLEVIPGELKRLTQEVERAKYEASSTEQSIRANATELAAAHQVLELWQGVFREDVRLVAGFYRSSEAFDEANGELGGLLHFLGKYGTDLGNLGATMLLQAANLVFREYGSLLSQRGLGRTEVADRLNRVFYQEQAMLLEYSFSQEVVLELQDVPELPSDEVITVALEQLKQKARRVQLSMDYFGKRVSPYFVASQIDRDILLQQSVLDERDRELYEEIIMHSVGRIIRARINRAEEWAGKIDQLMAERDTSSGLTFSLRWSPRPAEREEELDTKDLVDLLRSDPRLLKEEDMQRVTGHFRSRVQRAKAILEDRGLGYTLHQAIREMLDYRQWFSFKLYYQRQGEPKRELTNNVFHKLSGGEKAMAMYIPLFSAAYSRYLEARADAPYIISLDEAFAGVDENNIRDMFDLVEKLGFNYIMNSQSLWGDYDTVSSLAISELVRPKNAPYVGVVRYYWNGKVRTMVESAKEYEASFAG